MVFNWLVNLEQFNPLNTETEYITLPERNNTTFIRIEGVTVADHSAPSDASTSAGNIAWTYKMRGKYTYSLNNMAQTIGSSSLTTLTTPWTVTAAGSTPSAYTTA